MKCKKLIIPISILISSSICLSGCTPKILNTSKKPSFEETTSSQIYSLKDQVEKQSIAINDLQDKVKALQSKTNTNAENSLTADQIQFTSIMAVSPLAKYQDKDTPYLKENSKINLNVTVMNLTDKNLSGYYCQAVLKYYGNSNNLIGVYQKNFYFDMFAKTPNSDITFKDVPIKSKTSKHVLILNIKDSSGNTIASYSTNLNLY